MTKNTTYTVTSNDTVIGTRSSKKLAEKLATEFLAENAGAGVEVTSPSGKVVLEFKPKGQRYAPWSRVETPKFEVEVPAGFTAAYVRNRIKAVVARANDRSGWLVITPTETIEVKTSTEAREVTNDLAAKRFAAKAAA